MTIWIHYFESPTSVRDLVYYEQWKSCLKQKVKHCQAACRGSSSCLRIYELEIYENCATKSNKKYCKRWCISFKGVQLWNSVDLMCNYIWELSPLKLIKGKKTMCTIVRVWRSMFLSSFFFFSHHTNHCNFKLKSSLALISFSSAWAFFSQIVFFFVVVFFVSCFKMCLLALTEIN